MKVTEMFKNENFTFNEWLRLFQANDWLIIVFRSEYEYSSINKKKHLILRVALKG